MRNAAPTPSQKTEGRPQVSIGLAQRTAALAWAAAWIAWATPTEGRAEGLAVSEIQQVREGTRVFVGGGAVTGFLDFRSSPAYTQASLGFVPTGVLGFQSWLDETTGFEAFYQGSFLGTLTTPVDPLGGATLGFNLHQLEGHFLYRLFTGPRLDSMAFGVKVGFHLHNTAPSEHTPTILLSTTYFGPSLGATARVPFTEWLALEAEGGVILPFYVREAPDRSGLPRDALGFQGGGGLSLRIIPGLYVKPRYEYRQLQSSFTGTGTRALGKVEQASIFDQYHALRLDLEWVF